MLPFVLIEINAHTGVDIPSLVPPCGNPKRCKWFKSWCRAALTPELFEELQAAAKEAELPLSRFILEALESVAASRRLPRCSTPASDASPPGHEKEQPGGADPFPFPETTYSVYQR